ncbi:MAG TPA: zinc-binding dehydrogenase [Candidatus Binatia bacterium]|nr:zinc-binding dehydrogenase [Candidatus Binatia bacterium]
MKAIRIHHHGGVEQLRYEEAVEPQIFSADDVIVRLKTAAVNLTDIEVRQGNNGKPVCLPRILGSGGAGVVAAVASGVKELKSGDAVCLYPQDGCNNCGACRSDRPIYCAVPQRLGEHADGTYAEYLRVRWQNCFRFPAAISYEQAAAVPGACLPAWRMLMTNAELKPGETVLIRGIGGGAATAALQLALTIGAHTIVTAENGENISQALELGAGHAIDESKADFPAEVRRFTGKRGVDVVVDCLGGDGWAKSLAALSREGRLVSCGASDGAQAATDLRRIFWHHLKVFGSDLGSRDELRRVLNFMAATGVKPVIGKMYPLANAAAAQRHVAQGGHFGNTVLHIDA